MYKKEITITDKPFNIHNLSEEELKINEEVSKKAIKEEISIKKIKLYIEKYPNIPGLYNSLAKVYEDYGKFKKFKDLILETAEKFPDYMFAKINLANHYLRQEESEKVKEIFESFDITELYPERDVFHESEIFNFELMKAKYYFLENDLLKAADSYKYLKSINPYHAFIEEIEELMDAKIKKGVENFNIQLQGNGVDGKKYDKNKQTDVPPNFNHPEILDLYENSIYIDIDKLKTIINLPRKTLLEDLEKILIDAELRYEYFSHEDVEIENQYAPFHAFFILAEIRGKELLPAVLNFVSFDQTFIDFWLGDDFITEEFTKFVYFLSDESNYNQLFDFLLKPNIFSFAKSAVADCLMDLIYIKPELRENFVEKFKDTINYYLENEDNKDLFDDLFLSFFVFDLASKRIKELRPEIDIIFEKGLFLDDIVDGYDKLIAKFDSEEPLELLNTSFDIFEEYEYIKTNWQKYEYEDEGWDEEEEYFEEFLASLRDDNRELFNELIDDEIEDNKEHLKKHVLFIKALNEKELEAYIDYTLVLEEDDKDTQETLDFINLITSLDNNQAQDFISISEIEESDKFLGLVEKFKANLSQEQTIYFDKFIDADAEDDVIPPKLMKLLESLSDKKRDEFLNIIENDDGTEDNVQKVDKFFHSLNKKQQKLFLQYSLEISDEYEGDDKKDFDYDNYEPIVRDEPKIGRNDPCPCGSGKKYKKCCMNK